MAKNHSRKPKREPRRAEKDDRNAKKAKNASPPGGALFGRRVGRSDDDLGDVLSRPEKVHGTYPVDTRKKGISATDKKAGGESTARRNSRLNASNASYALEDSVSKPTRKSTRRGVHIKNDANLHARETARTSSPGARAERDTVRARKTRGRITPDV
jgi:hypothetical protein